MIPSFRARFKGFRGAVRRLLGLTTDQAAAPNTSTTAPPPGTTASTFLNRPSDPTLLSTSTTNLVPATSASLWSRAFHDVIAKDPDVLRPLAEELSIQGTDFADDGQLRAMVKKAMREHDARRLVLSIGGKSLHVREQGDKIIKFVLWSKDAIGPAVTCEPHAALAYVGVSLLLPVSTQLSPVQIVTINMIEWQLFTASLEQNKQMIDGLAKIANLLSLYKIRLEQYSARGKKVAGLEDKVVELFATIIEFEARCIQHLKKSTVRRLGSNIAVVDRWKQCLEPLDSIDKHIDRLISFVDQQSAHDAWEVHFAGMEMQNSLQRDMVKLYHQSLREESAHYLEKEMKACFTSLFSSRYEDDKNILPARVHNTCNWFLESEELKAWRETEGPSLLWLSGDAGCGKSVLSRYLVDHDHLSSSKMGSSVCYFFFKEGTDSRQNRANALAAILHQLFRQVPELTKYAKLADQHFGSDLCNNATQLWQILVDAACDPMAGEIVILLDALDECQSLGREQLLEGISANLGHESIPGQDPASRPRLKFFLTGQSTTELERGVRTIQGATNYTRVRGEDKTEQISSEIDLVIDAEVPKKFFQLEERQRQTIVSELKLRKGRTYLWLMLTWELLMVHSLEYVEDQVIKDLIGGPNSRLDEKYSQLLHKNKVQDHEQARIIFQLVFAARRSLHVEELWLATQLAMQHDADKVRENLLPGARDPEKLRSNLKNVCGSLLQISNERVNLLHGTVGKFLQDGGASASGSEWRDVHFSSAEAENTMAEVCMLVLKMMNHLVPKESLCDHDKLAAPRKQIIFMELHSALPNTSAIYPGQEEEFLALAEGPPTMAFVDCFANIFWYAVTHWQSHAAYIVEPEDSEVFLGLASCLLDPAQPSCMLWYEMQHFVEIVVRYDDGIPNRSTDVTPLALAVLSSFPAFLKHLLKDGCQINGPMHSDSKVAGCLYGNALCLALAVGHDQLAELLVQHNIDLNVGWRGRMGSPLWIALRRQNEKTLRLLLENEADMDHVFELLDQPGTIPESIDTADLRVVPSSSRGYTRKPRRPGQKPLPPILDLTKNDRYFDKIDGIDTDTCRKLLNKVANRGNPEYKDSNPSGSIVRPSEPVIAMDFAEWVSCLGPANTDLNRQ